MYLFFWVLLYFFNKADKNHHPSGHLCERMKSHKIQYADDILIVCEAEERQVIYMRAVLILFEAISGLHIKGRKSHIFPVNEVPNIQILKDILCMSLGVKSKSINIWNGVLERCEKKMTMLLMFIQ